MVTKGRLGLLVKEDLVGMIASRAWENVVWKKITGWGRVGDLDVLLMGGGKGGEREVWGSKGHGLKNHRSDQGATRMASERCAAERSRIYVPAVVDDCMHVQ